MHAFPRFCPPSYQTIPYATAGKSPTVRYAGRTPVCQDEAGRDWIQVAGFMRKAIEIVAGGEFEDVGQPAKCWTHGSVVAQLDEVNTYTYGGYLCPVD